MNKYDSAQLATTVEFPTSEPYYFSQGSITMFGEEFARVTKDDGFVVTCQTDRKINGEILPNHITYHNIMMYLGFKLKDYKIIVRNSVELKNMYTFNFQHMNIFTKSGTIKRSGDWLRDILVYPAKKIGKQHIWDESFVKMTLTYLSAEKIVKM